MAMSDFRQICYGSHGESFSRLASLIGTLQQLERYSLFLRLSVIYPSFCSRYEITHDCAC
jgi:hypothetical protein